MSESFVKFHEFMYKTALVYKLLAHWCFDAPVFCFVLFVFFSFLGEYVKEFCPLCYL